MEKCLSFFYQFFYRYFLAVEVAEKAKIDFCENFRYNVG